MGVPHTLVGQVHIQGVWRQYEDENEIRRRVHAKQQRVALRVPRINGVHPIAHREAVRQRPIAGHGPYAKPSVRIFFLPNQAHGFFFA